MVSTIARSRDQYNLRSVATDGAGNIYVSEIFARNRSDAGIGPLVYLRPLFRFFEEKAYETIRKITPAGIASHLVGESANLKHPDGIATDSKGNVYVADSGNHVIRKITPGRFRTKVSAFAGTGHASESLDGVALVARFEEPVAMATDSANNIYVVDRNSIRKITSAGVVTTLAGKANAPGSDDGVGSSARFDTPRGIVVDGAGNVYVADSSNHTIRKITPAGVVSTFVGGARQRGGADGIGSVARFSYPYGIAADGAGSFYVTDSGNSTIRKITADGTVSTLAGSAGVKGDDNGVGTAARFFYPTGIATDTSGSMYIADQGNRAIRKVTPDGKVSTLAGGDEVGYVDGAGTVARFSGVVSDVTTDDAGNVYVADTDNGCIRKITPAGEVSTFVGAPQIGGGNVDGVGTVARFGAVGGIATDGAGNIYVADTDNRTIRRVSRNGVVSTAFGNANARGSADGVGAAARFNNPRGVATDSHDNVYVVDTGNHTIRKITPDGAVSTLAGTAGVSGSSDGVGAAARFSSPTRMAIDRAGNIYVVDSGNHTVRKVTPAGEVSTLVGQAGQIGFIPGRLPGVLAFPRAVAIHGNSLYITMRNGVAVVTDLP